MDLDICHCQCSSRLFVDSDFHLIAVFFFPNYSLRHFLYEIVDDFYQLALYEIGDDFCQLVCV